eukprot:TRINITY_DN1801_c0_g3_i5.p1 TRINITY_DN1801_c0_g3~~TRINITY_DN1801_c0_g3_i5.p1  ORF type:complete len:482 (-),score=107.56 TRINITY_DN1801_c0_g3_i5:47-1492(-)
MGLTTRAVAAGLLSALGAFLFGLDIGYMAPVLTCPYFKEDVLGITDPKAELSQGVVGFIVGIFSLGCVFTSFPSISGYFLDVWGRRDSIVLGAFLFLLGCGLQACANSLNTMLLGRLVAGMSIGLLSTVVALYQSEVSAPGSRGAMSSMYQLMITFGIVVAAILGALLVNKPGGWRLSIALQAIPAFALIFGLQFLPRSPRWLMFQNRREDARNALHALRETPEEAEQELCEIESDCQAAKMLGKLSWIDLFDPYVSKLLCIGVVLQMLQQLVGMNAFMYYGPIIYGRLGLNANLIQVLTNTVNFIMTFPAIFCADVVGRRWLLLAGSFVMAVSCFAMGYLGTYALAEGGGQTSSTVTSLAVATVWIFVAAFAASWGPVVWVYCAEIFPLAHRSRCMGICTMSNWVGNYAVAQLTPVMLEAIGFKTFFVFGIFSLLSLALSHWIPETKGVPLEQMECVFKKKFGIMESKEKKVAHYGAVQT